MKAPAPQPTNPPTPAPPTEPAGLPPQPDRCIACTTCTAVCPVAQETPAFLGPRMTGPAYERFRLTGLGEDASLHYCSNCKNCDISCPCDVPVSTFIMRARAEVCKQQRPRLRDWLLAHGEVLARWMRPLPAALKNFGMNFPLTRSLLHSMGISRHAPLPEFASATFRQHFSRLRQPENLPRSVVLFPGCYTDLYDPESGLDMVAVLNRAGYRVIVPENFSCCGLPLVANGFWEDARDNASKNLLELKKWKEQNVSVLTGCPSCALMFMQDYHEYFPELVPRSLSPALADACEFIGEAIHRGELKLPHNGKAQHILYHAPCHLRAQGTGLPGLDLLCHIPGLQADNADAGCCGISGSYGFKEDKYALSMRIGEPLFKVIREHEGEICATECGTCRVQIHHGAGKMALHPVTLLRRHIEQFNY